MKLKKNILSYLYCCHLHLGVLRGRLRDRRHGLQLGALLLGGIGPLSKRADLFVEFGPAKWKIVVCLQN